MKNWVGFVRATYACIVIALILSFSILSLVYERSFAMPSESTDVLPTCPVGGNLGSDVTWNPTCIYTVMTNLRIMNGATLTIQPDTIVKFNMGIAMDVLGNLKIINGGLNHEVILTSIRDDTYGGDTNHDGQNTTPAPGDWNAVYLHNNNGGLNFENVILRYGYYGLTVWNDTSSDISPTIVHNTFGQNVFGVYLETASNYNITAQISNNVFTGNNYGLGTFQLDPYTGTSYPVLTANDFNNNTILPIFLGGSAFPTYTSNTFTGFPTATQRLGIGLGGRFTASGNWLNVNNMPYVVLANTLVHTGSTVTINQGIILKFASGTSLEGTGVLTIQGTAGNPAIFTSIRDDTNGGDTNGDGIDTEPLPGDWNAIYLDNSTSSFSYGRVSYSDNGLTVWNGAESDINPQIHHSVFSNNVFGVQLYICFSGNITSSIHDNQFTGNHYGFVTSQCKDSQGNVSLGTARPALTSNNFSGNTILPIYLKGSAFPVYAGNTFIGYPTALQRLGIGLSGTFTQDGSWDIVNNMPYVVLGATYLNTDQTIQLPEGMTIKFDSGMFIEARGRFTLHSTPVAQITFTSFKDDLNGDTNGDGVLTQPAPGDWGAVYLDNDLTVVNYSNVKYSSAGITIFNSANDSLNVSITNNSFIKNKTALYYRECAQGLIFGDLANNTFTQNTEFPIILNGTAYPIYSNNTFSGDIHPAIGITGNWNSDGSWPQVQGDQGQVFPYVITRSLKCDNTTLVGGAIIGATVGINVPGGTVFKFDTGASLDVLGNLILGSSQANQIVFTSYKDDSFKGDTNADSNTTTPAHGDWEAIYLESSATNFHDAIVKYSNKGLSVYNASSSPISPPIQNSHFEQNNFGVYLDIESFGDITSPIIGNYFINNSNGIGTFSFRAYFGVSRPQLNGNTISGNSEFPLNFQGSASPEYITNVFSNNVHPAIAVGGYWSYNTTWFKVTGDGNKIFPYVVLNTVDQDTSSTISMPLGLIVKFNLDTYLYAGGILDLQSNAQNPIVFTSYRDDAYAGDTNADSNATFPGNSDWKTIWLLDTPSKINHIHNIIAKYATAAVGVYYNGPVNTSINTSISDSTFSQNHVGVVLAIGWVKDNPILQGEGNIISPITNTIFNDNLYSFVTYAHSKSTGYMMPAFTNVQINRSVYYPIFLGGTSFPQFISGNTITTSAPSGAMLEAQQAQQPLALNLEFPDSSMQKAYYDEVSKSANQASSTLPPQMPNAGGLTINGPTSTAMALGGVYNNTGTLYQQDNFPYAVVGDFPLFITIDGVTDLVNNNLIVGSKNPQNSDVTFMPGTIVKFGPGLGGDVFGKLDLQGTSTKPVIFTSFEDDSAGGDTNKDGSRTIPAKADWGSLYLESSYTTFSNAVVKYATDGLFIYFYGEINSNINPEVKSSIFSNNKTGLTLYAVKDGDIQSDIHDNLFMDNNSDIIGHETIGNGRLMVNIHGNDLLGQTSFGINNLTTNWTIQALNNYWGDKTGPYHSTNPNGKGVGVSDRVQFNPWLSSQGFTLTYSVLGRVITTDANPVGIEGVTIQLSNGMTATTNAGGYFSVSGLPIGNYGITPVLVGYIFTPSSTAVNIPPDSTELTFKGKLSTQPTYNISGTVRELFGIPVNGVILLMDNGDSTVTGIDGNYSFINILSGTYKITPSLGSYTFTPAFRTVIIGPTKTKQDFKVNSAIGIHYLNYLPKVFH